MFPSLLAEVRRRAADAGLNLFGVVDAARFDAAEAPERRVRRLAPACGTVLVVGSGGRALWQQFVRRSGTCRPAAACCDDYVRDAVQDMESQLRAVNVGCRAVAGPCGAPLPFSRLAEAAGLGTVSPVTGLLLHPEFGPWVRIRAVVLADGQPFGPIADASISERFQPCCGCSRPCVTACPVGVFDGLGGQDLGRCAQHRDEGHCEAHCSSRAACPVGSGHGDADGEHAHRHAHSLRVMRRWFGLGVWRWLPSRWRDRP